jgi:hypothetical protein
MQPTDVQELINNVQNILYIPQGTDTPSIKALLEIVKAAINPPEDKRNQKILELLKKWIVLRIALGECQAKAFQLMEKIVEADNDYIEAIQIINESKNNVEELSDMVNGIDLFYGEFALYLSELYFSMKTDLDVNI